MRLSLRIKARDNFFWITRLLGSLLIDVWLEGASLCLFLQQFLLGDLNFDLGSGNIDLILSNYFTSDLSNLGGHLGSVLGRHLVGFGGDGLSLLLTPLLLDLLGKLLCLNRLCDLSLELHVVAFEYIEVLVDFSKLLVSEVEVVALSEADPVFCHLLTLLEAFSIVVPEDCHKDDFQVF